MLAGLAGAAFGSASLLLLAVPGAVVAAVLGFTDRKARDVGEVLSSGVRLLVRRALGLAQPAEEGAVTLTGALSESAIATLPILGILWEAFGVKADPTSRAAMTVAAGLLFVARTFYALSRGFFTGRRRLIGWPAGYDPREYHGAGRLHILLFLVLGWSGLGCVVFVILRSLPA